jgi:hypothetical protein
VLAQQCIALEFWESPKLRFLSGMVWYQLLVLVLDLLLLLLLFHTFWYFNTEFFLLINRVIIFNCEILELTLNNVQLI